MKQIIVWFVIAALTFLSSILFLLFGIFRKNKKLVLISIFAFVIFLGLGGWTGYQLVNKSYTKVAQSLKPRSGDEIYDALFDKRRTDCVKVLNFQDQIVPKIDYAIWLHFETCPKELKRILSRHDFSRGKLATNGWDGRIPLGEQLGWFRPADLGDTILVYEYSSDNSRNIQTIWASLDSTKVFCRDILD